AIQIAAHDSHAFAITPVEFPVLRIELELLGSEGATWRNNIRDIPTVEVSSINRAIIRAGVTHIGPVDVAAREVDHDTVGKFSTLANDGFQVGAVRVRRKDPTPGEIQEKQTADSLWGEFRCFGLGSFRRRHWNLFP